MPLASRPAPLGRPRLVLVALSLIALSTAVAAPALADTPFDGHWEGSIALPTGALELDIDLESDEADTITGDITIPIQNIRDMPLGGFERDGDSLEFTIPGIPGDPTFDGTLSDDGSVLAGGFTQGGGNLTFRLERAAPPADTARAALEELTPRFEKAIEEWNVPGLGVAVVHGGEVVYARGFGHRDLENDLPMTPDSLFAIGSTTKAMTATLLGILADEGKLDWDEPVVEALPSFRLADPMVTARVTPRDLVTHRTGMPRHDLLWYNEKELTREEIVERLEHLDLSADLREEWQYNNLMFLTAGYLAGQVDGRGWEDAMRARLFEPLGMTRTTLSVEDSKKDSDHALPYRQTDDDETDDEELERIPFRNIDLAGPAGSVNSSVNEMARWLLLNLRGGTVDGEQIVEATTLADIHSPHMTLPSAPGGDGRVVAQAYGLGWMTDVYRGHPRVHHGGGIDGFITSVRLYPADDLGIVAFTNTGSPLPSIVANTIADRLLDLEPVDWLGEELEKVRAGLAAAKQAETDASDAQVPGTSPSHDLADYAGTYEHPGYGPLEVSLDGETLSFTFNDITTPLEHWHYDVWRAAENEDDKTFDKTQLLFRTGFDGQITEVLAPFEVLTDPIVFARRPADELFDPAYLERFTGTYRGPTGQTAEISVVANGLSLQIPGQGVFELEPLPSGRFGIARLQGYTVGFEEDDQGTMSTLVFYQPNGVFRSERVNDSES